MQALYQQWWAHIGNKVATVAEIFKFAIAKELVMGDDGSPQKDSEGKLTGATKFTYPEFRQALLDVAGDNTTINTKKLGHWLKSRLGRRISIDGQVLRLVKGDKKDRNSNVQWSMVAEGPWVSPLAAPGGSPAPGDEDIPFCGCRVRVMRGLAGRPSTRTAVITILNLL
jgi:hypothetical protein